MATIGTLSVKAVAVFDDLFRGLSKAQSGIGALEKSFLGFGGAVALTAGGLAAWTHVADDAALRAGRMAERLGVTTESVQALYEQANRTGVSTNRLETWLHHSIEMLGMAKNQIDTAGHSFVKLNNGAKAFGELGISVAELRRNTDDQNLDRMLRALADIKDPAQRAAVAYKLMGKSAVESFSLIRDGMAGLDALKAKMRETGVSISRPDFLKLQAGKEAFADFQLIFKGLGTQIALDMAPVFVGVSRMLTQFIRDAGGVQVVAHNIVSGLVDIAGVLAEIGNVAAKSFYGLGESFQLTLAAILKGYIAVRNVISPPGDTKAAPFRPMFDEKEPGLTDIQRQMRKTFNAQGREEWEKKGGFYDEAADRLKQAEESVQTFRRLMVNAPEAGVIFDKLQASVSKARKEMDAAAKSKGDGLGGSMSDWALRMSLMERTAKITQDMQYPLETLARTYADLLQMSQKSFAPGAGLGSVMGLFGAALGKDAHDKALAQEFEKLASGAGLTKVQFAGALDVGSSEGARQAAVNQLNYQAHDAGVQNPQERVERILMELKDIEARQRDYVRQIAEAITKFKPGAIP